MRMIFLFLTLLLASSPAFAATWYVHRNADKSIASAHQEIQPGYAEEALDDVKDAEMTAWFAKVRRVVPKTVANWKGRAILVQRGLSDQVNAALAAIPDATQRKMAQIAINSADFTRDSPLINSILKGLNMSDDQIDQLYIDGNALSM